MLIYLAGSIWNTEPNSVHDWRNATEDILGVDQCLNPMRREFEDKLDRAEEIIVLDKLDIRRSDALLVCYIKPSVGTSMEVFYAWTLEKPIVVVNKSDEFDLPPWLHHHATYVCFDFGEAITWLEKHIA